ncbi:MAG: squalene--hopene cyclase [Oscillatoriales cyanobacterium RM2_1_1]|nr:squalene--hopene cyclase [Oscillatoriales cyanobacterium SM2_3_0]NJO47661.1 squalene--hopene cyclase [Oscillatoriales cyanobacterium RM2_1_1]
MDPLQKSIAASQNYLLAHQYPEGYWWAELESNVSITAEIVLLHKIWETDTSRPLHKVEAYLRSQQRDHGGWELFYGDGGELSTSVEAYMALRLLRVSARDPALIKARQFILDRGGISKTRIFTKLHLALIGCYSWAGLPAIPPWIMLLENPANFPLPLPVSLPKFSIYELSSWARSSTVPLIIVFDQKPTFAVQPGISLDELYLEGSKDKPSGLPRHSDWTDLFVELDTLFKLGEWLNLVPFRQAGLKAAEQWILERQEASGDWAGIIPAMLNSLLALKCLGYDKNDPVIRRGLAAVDRFALETADTYRMQACISPVWDTAWVVRSLVESGLAPDHAAVVKGAEWLLQKQILDYGDWRVKNSAGQPGGWAFEFENRFYPDLDDSAVVVMALNQARLPDETRKQAAIHRGLDWMMTMQCQAGGWAAFDIDNDQSWINAIPYGDLKAMIDPNTADVTARVLEMLGELDSQGRMGPSKIEQVRVQPSALQPSPVQSSPVQPSPLQIAQANHQNSNRIQRALTYLKKEQEADGSWFGRWGVNYIYGTSGALSALGLVEPQNHQRQIEKGVQWLVKCQNFDGGWGETCHSYHDPRLKGQGVSTPSQTAWGILGLIAAGEALGTFEHTALEKGAHYLIETQELNGRWEEAEFTGTGFPGHFYIKYHFYAQYFPLLALGRYQQKVIGR